MKGFFNCIAYGVKVAYQENREEIILVIVEIISAILLGTIVKRLGLPDEVGAQLLMVVCVINLFGVGAYFHYERAVKYSKEHQVSLEEAWKKTRLDEYSMLDA